ncbi:MAG TPA: DUF427 domain-containing protein [Solirubrobacteraceae bacterium]
MQAIYNGVVIAESDSTIVVEGNHYFPPATVRGEYLAPSVSHTTCAWKGQASYYTLDVAGVQSNDGAWYYPRPKDAAREIAGYVAFGQDVTVQ